MPAVSSLKPSITLVIPPSPFLLDERVFVSLGILRVASILEHHGHAVHLLDLSGVSNFEAALQSYLGKTGDELFGITATTPQLPSAFKIAQLVRQTLPSARLILGGPHVTLTMAAVRLEKKLGRTAFGRASKAGQKLADMFDVLVAGDGEIAIIRAVQPDSPKFLDGDDNRGEFFLTDKTYETMPAPARHLVDLRSYKYAVEGFPATSLIAQLGCPFNCGFCGGRNSKSLRVVRTRSEQSIVDEVEFLHREYGYTGFMFYDDELNVSKSMVHLMNRLTDLQARLGVEFRLRGFVKAELFTDEQAQAMYRAGFRWLLCGFEAADPRILTNIQKRATLDDNTRAVEIAKRRNLKVKALMSIGHPGENELSALAVQKWLVEVGADDFDCTIITTYPGTPYYDFAVPEGRKDVWVYTQPQTGDKLYTYDVDFTVTADYYKGDPNGGYRSFVFTDFLSSEELVQVRDQIERETRDVLGIPFNPARASMRFEHSMGQGLPDFILRASQPQNALAMSG